MQVNSANRLSSHNLDVATETYNVVLPPILFDDIKYKIELTSTK